MCGVPVHAAENYLARLIRAGHRVAIAEQTETPAQAKARGSKSLVGRAIVRYVTAGTLTADSLLDSRSANMLVAIGWAGGKMALAAAASYTGQFAGLFAEGLMLTAALAPLRPAEHMLGAGL